MSSYCWLLLLSIDILIVIADCLLVLSNVIAVDTYCWLLLFVRSARLAVLEQCYVLLLLFFRTVDEPNKPTNQQTTHSQTNQQTHSQTNQQTHSQTNQQTTHTDNDKKQQSKEAKKQTNKPRNQWQLAGYCHCWFLPAVTGGFDFSDCYKYSLLLLPLVWLLLLLLLLLLLFDWCLLLLLIVVGIHVYANCLLHWLSYFWLAFVLWLFTVSWSQ